ncbi:Kiwa anti-phage protein KwaB-like domain-containing protein [Marinomonas lutimaris]|uniref:Kiwa anti-phage protein KwaB-like domain-containing protein n=1 Tax=Marinomonas lutimaris TaxID=2846746 RepID=UPI001CA4A649|nr:Kiwa anti-phage protein KwaB-like domain-containing protein [Marinomonas lutimaris]
MLLNLFALTNNPANRIVRFKLTEDVQEELSGLLIGQDRTFDAAIEEEIEFDGKYKPDSGEALFIQNYDDIDNLENSIRNPLGVEEVIPNNDFFTSIKALFSGYENEDGSIRILLQYFDKRKIISTNGLSIFHSVDVYKKVEGIGISIDTKLSATLTEGKLRFFSFHLLRQVFDLTQYYKEATNDDITEFSGLENIKVTDNDHLLSISDSWVRRKISLIQQSEILSTVPMNQMKAVALEFNIPFETVIESEVEMIKLPDQKADLKMLLRFLDEDYYRSPLSNTNFVTNSKREA